MNRLDIGLQPAPLSGVGKGFLRSSQIGTNTGRSSQFLSHSLVVVQGVGEVGSFCIFHEVSEHVGRCHPVIVVGNTIVQNVVHHQHVDELSAQRDSSLAVERDRSVHRIEFLAIVPANEGCTFSRNSGQSNFRAINNRVSTHCDTIGQSDSTHGSIVNSECDVHVLFCLEYGGESDVLRNGEGVLGIGRNGFFANLPCYELIAGFRSSLNSSVSTNSYVTSTGNSTLCFVASYGNFSRDRDSEFEQSNTVSSVVQMDVSAVLINRASNQPVGSRSSTRVLRCVVSKEYGVGSISLVNNKSTVGHITNNELRVVVNATGRIDVELFSFQCDDVATQGCVLESFHASDSRSLTIHDLNPSCFGCTVVNDLYTIVAVDNIVTATNAGYCNGLGIYDSTICNLVNQETRCTIAIQEYVATFS